MQYVFPAVFTRFENGNYSVSIPDCRGVHTQGKDLTDAIFMARDALALWLDVTLEDGDIVPLPSDPASISLEEGEFTTLIDIDLGAYRRRRETKTIKKTVTMPSWLNETAEAAGLNFSRILQDALRERLKISD